MALVVGLTALASGVSMLLVGVMLPAFQYHPVAIIAAAANQAAAAPIAVPQDLARAPEDPRLLTASSDRTSNARRAGPITTHEHRNTEQIALVRPGLDIFGGSPRPSPCLKTDLERANRAESTQLATIPLRQDPREALITLVAAQHGGLGDWSGACLMRRLTVQNPGQADSDDRIANALFDDPILVPGPSLMDVSATTQTARLFTVTGTGFTAGGHVYLAIYDQMGAQLYETRWITASLPLLAVAGPTGHEAASLNGSGGTLREAFANLCGATAMMRAYDQATTIWSTWLTVEPTCTAYIEPRTGPR